MTPLRSQSGELRAVSWEKSRSCCARALGCSAAHSNMTAARLTTKANAPLRTPKLGIFIRNLVGRGGFRRHVQADTFLRATGVDAPVADADGIPALARQDVAPPNFRVGGSSGFD